MEGSQREETMKNRNYVLGLLVVVLVSISTAVRAQAPEPQKLSFTFHDAKISGALEVDSYWINNRGWISGDYILSDGTWHGMKCKLAKSGSCTNVKTIDDPNGTHTTGQGINTAGDMVGYYVNSAGNYQGFLYKGGTFTDISGPEGSIGSLAIGINDKGLIVGWYQDSAGVWHGFLYDGTTYTDLTVPGASATYAQAINNKNWIVLVVVNSSGLYDSYLTTNKGNSYNPIDVPGAAQSWVNDINNAGNRVYTIYDSQGVRHGDLYYGGKYTQFDDPKGTNTRGDAVNDSLVIVGRYGSGPSGGNGGYGYEAVVKK
jgi:probable HAF family extracellular repeat protein